MLNPKTVLALAPDLHLIPVRELDPDEQRRLGGSADDVALSRVHGRSASLVVEPEAARWLEKLRRPTTLEDAILLHTLPRQLDPHEFLEKCLPMVVDCFRRGFIIDSKNSVDRLETQKLQVGEHLEAVGATVTRTLQRMDDSSVYLVRLDRSRGEPESWWAALKVTHPGARRRTGQLESETAVLAHLGGSPAPQLLESGTLYRDSCPPMPYTLTEWISGTDVGTAAALWRQDRTSGGSDALLHLLRGVARAYAALHLRGVVHGDVHPRNALVDRHGRVRLIDFGASSVEDGKPRKGRPGIAFYFEPELALSMLSGESQIPASQAGEQFSVAAMLYFLATGHYYQDFRLERTSLLRQIAEDPPLSFVDRRLLPWPALESVLRTALSKKPEDRFASLDCLASSLDRVGPPPREQRHRVVPPVAGLDRYPRRLRALAALDGPWLRDAPSSGPTATVVHGAAGIGLALLRTAQQRDDPELLSLAAVWAEEARQRSRTETGILNADLGIKRELVGWQSPFHCESGVHAVRALVARARMDPMAYSSAAADFAEAASGHCHSSDLTLGLAGIVRIAALICGGVDASQRPVLLDACGQEALENLWRHLDEQPEITPVQKLGAAHGWAGQLYATLLWCRTVGAPIPSDLERRLCELADCAEPHARGLRWRWRTNDSGQQSFMPGWCNGSAGFVSLWIEAWQTLGQSRFLDLAIGAAWDAWEAPDTTASLCCGLVGRSYALLSLFRLSGERAWLSRALDLADRAATDMRFSASFPHSLFKGETGLAVLAADLSRPEDSAMPWFDAECWPSPEGTNSLAGSTKAPLPEQLLEARR